MAIKKKLGRPPKKRGDKVVKRNPADIKIPDKYLHRGVPSNKGGTDSFGMW